MILDGKSGAENLTVQDVGKWTAVGCKGHSQMVEDAEKPTVEGVDGAEHSAWPENVVVGD